MIKNARARSNNYDIRPVQPRLRLATGAVNTVIAAGAVNTAIATGAGTTIATGAVNISRRSSSVPANSATNGACSSMQPKDLDHYFDLLHREGAKRFKQLL